MNISLALKHQQLARHQAEAVTKACREAELNIVFERPSYATAAGDERKLRGIPAIGRGVTGALHLDNGRSSSPHAIR